MPKHRANGEGNIRKRADGRWEARYTDTRETDPKKRLKYITNKSQKVVIEKLKAALAEIDGSVPLLVNDNPTVAEWLSLWLVEYKRAELRDSTYESYERHIQSNLMPLIGHVRLKNLTGLHIQQMYNRLQDSKSNGGYGLGAASVTKNKNILSGALQQAVMNKLIRSNPVAETNPPKVEDSAIRVMTKAEQQQFISVLPFYNTGNMFAVALATGMRIGEICALDVDDIDRESKIIKVNKTAGRRKDKYTGEVAIKVGSPQTKHSIRKIPLLPSVEIILDRQAQLVSDLRKKAGGQWNENTLVFPTEGGNIHDLSGLRSSLKRILARSGLPHMAIHALRHTYATTALNSGVAAQNVSRLLGHKDGATTLRFYAHYINTEAMTQMEKMEEQNISHLGITPRELEKIVMGTAAALEKSSVSIQIDDVVLRAKNFPRKKSVEMVLSVCNDILCDSLSDLSTEDKEVLLGVLAQYTSMQKNLETQAKNKKSQER